jgi:hypothetical protein
MTGAFGRPFLLRENKCAPRRHEAIRKTRSQSLTTKARSYQQDEKSKSHHEGTKTRRRAKREWHIKFALVDLSVFLGVATTSANIRGRSYVIRCPRFHSFVVHFKSFSSCLRAFVVRFASGARRRQFFCRIREFFIRPCKGSSCDSLHSCFSHPIFFLRVFVPSWCNLCFSGFVCKSGQREMQVGANRGQVARKQ